MPTSLIYFENDAISRGNLLILGTFPRVIDTFLYDYVVGVGAWRICRRHSLPADNDRFVQMKTVCCGKVRAEKQKNAKYGIFWGFCMHCRAKDRVVAVKPLLSAIVKIITKRTDKLNYKRINK